MDALKAIETRYKGYRFRSRLEARWAVFFDTLGIEYRYEYEGFDVTVAGWYLPDFYLPEQKYWIEIKGQWPTIKDKKKAFYFHLDVWNADDEVDELNDFHSVYVFWGDIPWPYPSKGNAIAAPDIIDAGFYRQRYCWQQCPVCRRLGIGVMGEPFCAECLERLRNAVSFEAEVTRIGHPAEPEALSEAARKVGIAVVNEDVFRSAHRSASLQLAYAEARGARF